jgi:hypothetical protein
MAGSTLMNVTMPTGSPVGRSITARKSGSSDTGSRSSQPRIAVSSGHGPYAMYVHMRAASSLPSWEDVNRP